MRYAIAVEANNLTSGLAGQCENGSKIAGQFSDPKLTLAALWIVRNAQEKALRILGNGYNPVLSCACVFLQPASSVRTNMTRGQFKRRDYD